MIRPGPQVGAAGRDGRSFYLTRAALVWTMGPVQPLRFWRVREVGTALVLLLMLGICEIAKRAHTHSSFLLSDDFTRIFQDASPVGIAALGACIVILSGGVDLSSGSVMSLGAVTFAYFFQVRGLGGSGALLLGILAGGLVGAANGLLVGCFRLPPFIATLGFLSVARGISFWITGGPVIPVEWRGGAAPLVFRALGDQMPWVMVGLAVVLGVLMARFSWGRYVYAVGGNEEAARFSGLRIAWIKGGIYTVAGLLSALAGAAMSLRYGSAYVAMASGYELRIIAACAMGGVSFSGGQGSIAGALLGALALQVLESLLLQLRVDAAQIDIAYGAAIILAVAVDLFRTDSRLGRWMGRKTA